MTSLEAIKYLKENKRRHWLEGDLSKVSLESIEKDLKVLKIIKEKKVDILEFEMILNRALDVIVVGGRLKRITKLEIYNNRTTTQQVKELTQSEFDAIKDWLERQ